MGLYRHRPLAVVGVAAGPDATDQAARCVELCEEQGYLVVGVVIGIDNLDRYGEVLDLLERTAAEVLVTPSRADLPPQRTPRVETVTGGVRPRRRDQPPRPRFTR